MSAGVTPKCACEICKNAHDFNMPPPIMESIKAGKLTLFAGAGISTESTTVYKQTFYADIADELGISDTSQWSFPALLSKFCDQPNGRRNLLIKLKKRIDYVRSFPELYRTATRFHRELATLYKIENIFTTNWDDFFELESGAVPYVNGEDFALWNMPGRKVFKLHGSINNLGSIVATAEDYSKCVEKLSRGTLGSILKTSLATSTIVFVGYSLSDDDFREIYGAISTDMDGLQPHAYFITLDNGAREKLSDLNLSVIVTDGTEFLRRIKEHLAEDDCWLPDMHYVGLDLMCDLVERIHEELFKKDIRRYPMLGYTLSYQDGLLHALERVKSQRKNGDYSHRHHIQKMIHLYEDMRRQKVLSQQYWDASYIEGYINGMIWFLMPLQKRIRPPVYFIYGLKNHPTTKRDYFKLLTQSEQIHKAAYKRAKRNFVKVTAGVKGINIHHPPFL